MCPMREQGMRFVTLKLEVLWRRGGVLLFAVVVCGFLFGHKSCFRHAKILAK